MNSFRFTSYFISSIYFVSRLSSESFPSGLFQILHVCLALGFVCALSFDVERYFIKRDKNPPVKSHQTVIKIISALFQVKCLYPIFKECSNDKKKLKSVM